MFKQDVAQFFGSKSNWTALAMIIGSSYGFYQGMIAIDAFIGYVTGGIALISVRDAVAKT